MILEEVFSYLDHQVTLVLNFARLMDIQPEQGIQVCCYLILEQQSGTNGHL